jgi:hypothetical protein
MRDACHLIVKFCKAPVTNAGATFRTENELNTGMGFIKSSLPWIRLLPSLYGTPLFAGYSLFPTIFLQNFFRRTWLAFLRWFNGSHRSSLSAARVGDRFRRGRSWKEKKEEAATRRVEEAASFKSSD